MKYLTKDQMLPIYDFNKIDIKTICDAVYSPNRILVRYALDSVDSRVRPDVESAVDGSRQGADLWAYSQILMSIKESLADRFEGGPPDHTQQAFIDLLGDLSNQITTF